ncbi:MAG TPA: putative lipid II flippase FtsW [Solirubrobacteraceae bacterium]|nr:putative lipid II flippase FtsW [Solirubrobacteraceae bacterium]
MTATLCLLAFGSVMIYSASSPVGALAGGGSGAGEFLRYIVFVALGVVIMYALERHGLQLLSEQVVRLLLLGAGALLVLVLVPHFGVQVQGARRWFAAGPIQFQPSEICKLALVLYTAQKLARPPRGARSWWELAKPVAGPALLGCGLIVLEPDLGTSLVVALTMIAMLLAAGMPPRYLAAIVGAGVFAVLVLVLIQPYEQARLTAFLHPWSAATKAGPGYQAVQGQIALGSGGLFGVGLGKSVQKVFYLPEANTDFILAVIGEELGVIGIFTVVCLYGMIAYAGLRTARRAATRHAKLLATGLTSLILCQGTLNIFVVLGLAPLTGVPLPFISYAPTNLWVMLASVGLLLNMSRPKARRLRVVDPRTAISASESRASAKARERRRRERAQRRAAEAGSDARHRGRAG